MKPYERRAIGAYPYFTLAEWDDKLLCFRDSKRTFSSYAAAQLSAVKQGIYRISKIPEHGPRKDFESFVIK